MSVIKHATIHLPNNQEFQPHLFTALTRCGVMINDSFYFAASNALYLPQLRIKFDVTMTAPAISFIDKEEYICQPISNETGEEWASPHTYGTIPLAEFLSRLAAFGGITAIDHLGINFPWRKGESPVVRELREKISAKTAYFRLPDEEICDFILPATINEIAAQDIDLTAIRRPKLELVSFPKSSTPLMQIDCFVKGSFHDLCHTFPEALIEDELEKVWVYIDNPFGLDFCFVLNEFSESDWSAAFSGQRQI